MSDAAVVTIAGAGIAGLTAALALARHGMASRVCERAPCLSEIGAGVQLSPNATRLLARLGVLQGLAATAPLHITLREAKSLAILARMPLGEIAERRWGAPYLVVHRADLQAALVERVRGEPAIGLATGVQVEGAGFQPAGLWLQLAVNGAAERVRTPLLIGADGVWSQLRGLVRGDGRSRFSGHVAWRATLADDAAAAFADILPPDQVTAFADPAFHLVAYGLGGGRGLNMVFSQRGSAADLSFDQAVDEAPPRRALEGADGRLADLSRAVPAWSSWPIHEVDARAPWTHGGGLALIGDAAHAVTPFAAQGAAMAIEDAVVLAGLLSRHGPDRAAALAAYERTRRPRVLAVARRGAFNRFAWHAAGPVALVRNAVLKARRGTALMSDLDWLYGFDAEAGFQN